MNGPGQPDELAVIATVDLAGLCRGRAFRLGDLDARLRTGVGWVPANLALHPFGGIVEPNAFGALGDLRLLPDPATRVRLPSSSGRGPLTLLLSHQVHPDGSAWDGCPRTFLVRALDALEQETGLRVVASFEHEFTLAAAAGPERPPAAPFSVRALEEGEPLGTELVRVLHDAGLEPETWLPEYGPHQWEVTLKPASALVAADRAIVLREAVHAVTRALGRSATFAPLVDPDGVGNGVHVHLSLTDAHGVPVTYDALRPGGLSQAAAQFAAGILAHAPALIAVTAPTTVSGLRLRPHRWSAGSAFLGERNREALVRICPPLTMGDADPSGSANIEFRGADAGGNPWLVLGALVRAGLEGIRSGLEPPAVVQSEVDDLDDEQRRQARVGALPVDLSAALDALEADAVARSWFPPLLLETYLTVKRAEVELHAGLDDAERCRRYADVY
jgi:glutamine synthetase